jgi:hypothetical protein
MFESPAAVFAGWPLQQLLGERLIGLAAGASGNMPATGWHEPRRLSQRSSTGTQPA